MWNKQIEFIDKYSIIYDLFMGLLAIIAVTLT